MEIDSLDRGQQYNKNVYIQGYILEQQKKMKLLHIEKIKGKYGETIKKNKHF